MDQLRIELLGGFRVSVGDRAVADVAWHRRKPAALVKLLALAPGHRLHREEIMDALWPELDPEAAGLRGPSRRERALGRCAEPQSRIEGQGKAADEQILARVVVLRLPRSHEVDRVAALAQA